MLTEANNFWSTRQQKQFMNPVWSLLKASIIYIHIYVNVYKTFIIFFIVNANIIDEYILSQAHKSMFISHN